MDSPTVLLIDGDQDSLTIYTLILQHHGFRVLQATDGEQGFTMACEHRPDLVVLEPFVALVRGKSIMELLRTDDRTATLQMLMVTAVPNLLEDAGSRGELSAEYLVKPCQPRRFLAEVLRRLDPELTAV